MKLVILDGYTENPSDLSWEKFDKAVDVKYYDRIDSANVGKAIKDADFVLTNKTVLGKEEIDNAPNLKYIGVLATGYNVVDIDYAKTKNIVVSNIPSYGTDSVAQMCFALILEMYNQVGLHNTAVQNGEWVNSKDFCFYKSPLIELAGKTIGIVGFGRIGKAVAKIAESFSMNILANDVYQDKNVVLNNFQYVGLDEIAKRSDVISLHCNLTDENKEFVNKEFLTKMKSNAIIINTSRGGLINEKDLAEAVVNKVIKGAGLDVISVEPMKPENPLRGVDNIILTPHISWATKEARSRLMEMAFDNFKNFLDGNPINVVNK